MNASHATLINSVVVGGGITVGGLGDFLPQGPFFTFNAGAVGNIATTPNALGKWSPAAPGGMAGLAASNVLVTHDATGTPNGAAWECSDLNGGDGQLTILMDVNWLNVFWNPPASRNPEIENIQTFLQRTCIIQIDIDIKPGSDPNCFNNDGNGVIPVAILGSATFDVTQVDPSTVQLEGLSVASKGKSGKLMAHVEDVNGDGIDDLIVQIEDVEGTFTSGSGTATLTGNLFDGTPFEGSDDICVVPSAPPPPPPPPPHPDEETPAIGGLQPPDETPLFVWNPDLGVDYTAGSPAVIDLTRLCPSADGVLCESLMFEAVDLGTGVEDGSCSVECADDDLDGNLIDVVILDSPSDAYNGTSLFTNNNGLGTDMFQAVFCEGGPSGPLCDGQDDGVYTVRVLVSDQASPQNNVATVDYPFVLDTNPPIIGFGGLTGLNSSNAATVEFVLTATVVDRNGDGTALELVTVDVSIEDITNGGADGDCTTLGDQLFTEADVLVSPNADASGLTVMVDVTAQVNTGGGDMNQTFTAANQRGNLGLGDYTYCFLITAEDGAERKDGTDISAVAGDITSVAGKDFNWQ